MLQVSGRQANRRQILLNVGDHLGLCTRHCQKRHWYLLLATSIQFCPNFNWSWGALEHEMGWEGSGDIPSTWLQGHHYLCWVDF